jgi:hypothetical protein
MCRRRPRRAPKGARDRCVSPTACAPSPSPRRRRRRRARGCAPFPDRRSSCRHLYLASPRERLCRAASAEGPALPPPLARHESTCRQGRLKTAYPLSVRRAKPTHPVCLPLAPPAPPLLAVQRSLCTDVDFGSLPLPGGAWQGQYPLKSAPAHVRRAERCHAQPRCSCHDGCHGMKTGMNVMIMPRSPRSHHR